jgi:hypothetical protein
LTGSAVGVKAWNELKLSELHPGVVVARFQPQVSPQYSLVFLGVAQLDFAARQAVDRRGMLAMRLEEHPQDWRGPFGATLFQVRSGFLAMRIHPSAAPKSVAVSGIESNHSSSLPMWATRLDRS